MTPRNRLRSVLSGACLVAGCAATVHDPSARREGRDARPAPTAVAPARGLDASALLAVLPDGASPFAPALTRVAPEPAQGRGAKVADVEGCAECHADVALQWGRSAHAFASFDNPVYRTVVDGFRHDRGEEKSQFCGGCHDPALLLDGAMRAEIKPADARARAGVSCRVCHGVTHARADGNGSYDLDLGATVVPRDGEPESRLRHRATVARATLRTAEMCATCHKAFLDPSTGNAAHLVGQDDATPWARSAFAGSHGARIDDDVERRRCQDCHMPAVDVVLGDAGAKRGKVRSHEFLGGHTWLAAMLGDRQLTARAASFLKGRVSLDVAAVRVGGARTLLGTDPAAVREDDAVVLDLVMRNLDVGHAFPGGVRDAQDTWLEVVVTDASGARVAEAGAAHAARGDDPTAYQLASYAADASGARRVLRETHLFRAPVYDHTLPARDAAVVSYAMLAPRGAARYPLRVEARLRHRSRNLALARAACAASRTQRGRAFVAERARPPKPPHALDPCAEQPITDVASASAVLSLAGAAGAPAVEGARANARAFAYGLGEMHALQERLDDARAPLEAALASATTDRERAMALGALAELGMRQGRVDEAFARAREADDAASRARANAVAMQRVRAEALLVPWKLAEAAPLFGEVASRSPRDDGAWSSLAVALGGAGSPAAALEAAQRGLALSPRDADMLRVQAIALADLGAIPGRAVAARDAFAERRPPDDAPAIRAKCSAHVPGCALERVPAHVRRMRQP